MELEFSVEFSGKIWFWRGPAPFYFVTVPLGQSRELKALSGLVSYGWGMVPVNVRIGQTEWKTSLWPKDGRYIVPLKDSVRIAENLDEGDEVTIRLEVGLGR
jgi:uncharacterized protein DUF1905